MVCNEAKPVEGEVAVEMINELITKLKKQRDEAVATPSVGLKEDVVLNKVLIELNKLQVNMEIRERTLKENVQNEIRKYFTEKITAHEYEVDVVDCNADVQKIIKEQFEKLA